MKTGLQPRSGFCFSGAEGSSVHGTTGQNLCFHTSHSSGLVHSWCTKISHETKEGTQRRQHSPAPCNTLKCLNCLKCQAVAGEEEELGSQLLCVTGTGHSTRTPCPGSPHCSCWVCPPSSINTGLHQQKGW